MLKTYYVISPDLKIVLTTLHEGEGGQEVNHCYRRKRANKLLVSTIFVKFEEAISFSSQIKYN
jgi:hypothetical protein